MSASDSCFYNPETQGYSVGHASDVAAAMLKELQPSLLTLSNRGFDSGSALVLDDNDHAGTNMHAALVGDHIDVKTPSGQILDGYVEKLDPILDLAVLKVPGLNQSGARPAKLDLAPESTLGHQAFTIGAPWAADGRPMCVSEGTIQEIKSYRDEWRKPVDRADDETGWNDLRIFMDIHFGKEFDTFTGANKEALFQRSIERFSSPRLVSDAVATSGVSVGVLSTGSGVDGIVQMGSTKYGSRAIPVSNLVELARAPSRFTFQYDGSHNLKSILPKDSSDATATAEATLATMIMQRDQKIIDDDKATPKDR